LSIGGDFWKKEILEGLLLQKAPRVDKSSATISWAYTEKLRKG
jgi:hypothetical protein